MTSPSFTLPRGRLVRAPRTPHDDAQAPPPRASEAEPHSPATQSAVEHLLARRAEVAERRAGLPDTIELARALAERLVGEALATRDDALAHWAEQLLDEARAARSLRLSAAPADLERLRPALAGLDLSERDLTLVADSSLANGSFRLETELGELEASVSEALAVLAERLRAQGLR